MRKIILAISILTLLPCSSAQALSADAKSKICGILAVTACTAAVLTKNQIRRPYSGTLIGVALLLAFVAHHYSQEKNRITIIPSSA